MVESVRNSEPVKPPVYVQQEVAKEVLKETTEGSNGLQKELLMIMNANIQAQKTSETAQKQLAKGYLDVRI